MAALRRAAAMAHTVGGITLRLSAGGEHLVEVRPDPAARPCPSHRIADPCGFRMAVARAWADFEAGREIGLIGLGPDDELDIDWAVAPPGQDLGFGAVRAGCADRVVWAFASILDTPALGDVVGRASATASTTCRPAPSTACRRGSSATTCWARPSCTSRPDRRDPRGSSTRCCGGWSPSSGPPSCWTRSPDPRERTAPPGCGDLGGAGAQPDLRLMVSDGLCVSDQRMSRRFGTRSATGP